MVFRVCVSEEVCACVCVYMCVSVRDAMVYCRTVRYAFYGSIRTYELRYYGTPVNFLYVSKLAYCAAELSTHCRFRSTEHVWSLEECPCSLAALCMQIGAGGERGN